MSQPASFGAKDLEELPREKPKVTSKVWPILEKVEPAAGSTIRPEVIARPHDDYAARDKLKHDIAMMLKK